MISRKAIINSDGRVIISENNVLTIPITGTNTGYYYDFDTQIMTLNTSEIKSLAFVKMSINLDNIKGKEKITSIGGDGFNNLILSGNFNFPNCRYIDTNNGFRGKITEISLPVCEYLDATFFNAKISNLSLPKCSYIGWGAFRNCSSLQSVDLPNCFSIRDSAFYSCYNLQSVNLPNCSYVWSSAFYNCYSLQSVNLPNCSYIGDDAFWCCSNLQSVSLPNCNYIGSYAFYSTYFSELNLPKLYAIGSNFINSTTNSHLFTKDSNNGIYCSVNSNPYFIAYYIPRNSTYSINSETCIIGAEACSQNSYIRTFSNSNIIGISPSAFYSCSNLSSVNLPNCKYIGYRAFYSCMYLRSISLPNCEYIGNYTFGSCSDIRSISLPKCSYIEDNAFYYCNYLRSINLSNCSYIGNYAFEYCNNLTNLTITYSSVPILGNSAFYNCNNLSIYVPSSLYSSYITATNWVYYSSRIVSM